MTDPEITIEVITPALAKTMLGGNKDNRQIRQSVVSRYARDMKSGVWHEQAGMPVMITADGTLLNGQHRLHACIKAGVSFRSMVMRNADPAAMPNIDKLPVRSLADTLRWANEQNAGDLAAAIRVGWLWTTGQSPHNRTMSPSTDEALDWLDRNPSIRDAVRVSHVVYRSVRSPRSITAVIVHRFRLISMEDADRFIKQVESGIELPEGSPAAALRNWIFNQLAASRGAARTLHVPSVYQAMWVQAWNAYVLEKPIKIVRYKQGDPFPVLLGADGRPAPLVDERQITGTETERTR